MSTIDYRLVESLISLSDRYKFRSDHGWTKDPATMALVQRGTDLLPTLIFLLNARGDLVDPWLLVYLLEEVTGEQPWSEHRAGELPAIIAGWVQWAVQRGIRLAPVNGRVVGVEASGKIGHIDLLVEDEDGRVWRYYGCFPVAMRHETSSDSQLTIKWNIEY